MVLATFNTDVKAVEIHGVIVMRSVQNAALQMLKMMAMAICGHNWGDARDDEDSQDDGEEDTPSCPKCHSDNVTDDGSDYLQYECNDCGNMWGHCDEKCPVCGSTDVEDDGYDYMQYTCNNCGHNWGD